MLSHEGEEGKADAWRNTQKWHNTEKYTHLGLFKYLSKMGSIYFHTCYLLGNESQYMPWDKQLKE